MNLVKALWGHQTPKQTNNRIEQSRAIVAKATPEQWRLNILSGYLQHCAAQTRKVFQAYKVKGEIVNWFIAHRYVGICVKLASPKYLDAARRLTTVIGSSSGLGQGKKVLADYALQGDLVVYQFAVPEEITLRAGQGTVRLWTDLHVDDPGMPFGAIGMALDQTPVYLEFTDSYAHVLVCGVSGSGKTKLLEAMAYQLCQTHTIDELGLAIVDPNGYFHAFDHEAHMLYQPARDREDIAALIARIELEYESRKRGHVPITRRVVLIIDEGDDLITLLDQANQDRVNNILLRGRASRVNVIVCTHVPNAKELGAIPRGLTNKFLGQQAGARPSGEIEAGANLHLLAGRGDMLHAQGGRHVRFQGALVSDELLARLPQGNPLRVLETQPEAVPDELDLPTGDGKKPNHRPSIEATPDVVAYFRWHLERGAIPTKNQIRATFGLKETGYKINKLWAESEINYYKLICESGGQPPPKERVI